ncbi:MAG TPA: DUF1800 domain-containing protein, partial [Candidatus Kapabacteria bacterium]|nr:DUF1800 domain-containing protein [Candidatus Kapabacteria bacterium]
MDRRAFLTSFYTPRTGTNYTPAERTLPTGLEPFVPSASAPWDATRVGHLLRRTMMLPKWGEITQLMGLTPSAAVDLLLNTPSDPARPAAADVATEDPFQISDPVVQNGIIGGFASTMATLQKWWQDVFVSSPLSIVEKMTFFWSGHFTTQFNLDNIDYVQAPLLYRQNQLFRALCLASFRDMAFGATIDGGMIIFLGGNLNNKSHPNENYARELMELFTMGIGNYSEGDVREAARILTGWHTCRYTNSFTPPSGIFSSYFNPLDHDQGSKTYLGVQFAAVPDAENTEFLVKKNEIEKLIDTIIAQRTQETAIFVCRKIYRFFVYSSPSGTDETVITAMAKIFTDNNFQIKPVIDALLKSAHFYDNANIGAQIKTPAEYVIGFARQLGYGKTMEASMDAMLQTIFQPPNVSGWTGWHDWITTNTFPVRSKLAADAIAAMTDD